jgi:hypothetical protein
MKQPQQSKDLPASPVKKGLVEGVDYYLNEKGQWVFTESYHLERGYCCKSGCRHCPYGFKKEA